MSNIIKTKNDLYELKEKLQLLKEQSLRRETLKETIDLVLPKDENGNDLINSRIKDCGGRTAIFVPRYRTIEFSLEKCQEWVVQNMKDLAEMYGIKDRDELESYLSLFIILHEVEHSYQYLMGQKQIAAPCELMQAAYKRLNDLLTKQEYIIPRPIKEIRRMIAIIQYYKKQEMYALERNANIEALGNVLALAQCNGNEEIMRMLTDMIRTYMTIGYENDRLGVFYHTFKDIGMFGVYKSINHTSGVDMDKRALYGLEISEEKREEVMLKAKGRTI